MQTGYEATTKGGWLGHGLRRMVHIAMAVVPWIYYHYAISATVLWVLLILLVVLEGLRLTFGLQLFGQRVHEAKRISSFAWGGSALLLVLLLSPPMFAYPIIVACALGDPLLGELRRLGLLTGLVVVCGLVVVAAIWLGATWWLATPWWWALIMAPLTVVAEWPNLKWIDDNAMMQLVPLIVVSLRFL